MPRSREVSTSYDLIVLRGYRYVVGLRRRCCDMGMQGSNKLHDAVDDARCTWHVRNRLILA